MGQEKIISLLKGNQSFLVMGHLEPDVDAIGSAIALVLVLRDMGKSAYLLAQEPLPRPLHFLCPDGISVSQVEQPVDVMISVDCGDFLRTGLSERTRGMARLLVNIDHHVTNPNFGDVNWVVPEATASAEMIYHLAMNMGRKISPPIALALYAALLVETGSFRYQNTTSKTLKICAELIESGADIQKISCALFETNSRAKLNLLSEMLSQIAIDSDKKIAWVKISLSQIKAAQAVDSDTNDFIDFLRSIDGVEVAVLFREVHSTQYKVSLRSKGRVDVSLIAKALGGGGHRNASGCTLNGSWHEIREQVLGGVSSLVSC